MTDSLVSVFEQISENVLHTKIDYFCAKYKKSQLLTKNEKTTSPSCQFSFSSLVLDAILAFEKLQMLHVRQLRFPTAPVCQEKKHSQIINLDSVFSIFRY